MLKWLLFAGIFLGVGITPGGAKTTAAPLSSKRAELKGVQSEISAVDHHAEHLQAQQQALQQQLAEIETKIGAHAITLKNLQHQIDQKNLGFAVAEKDLRVHLGQMGLQKKILKDQILAAYHAGQQDRLKLVLNNQNPVLSGRLLNYYDYLSKVRLQKVAQLEAQAKRLVLLRQQQKQSVDSLGQVQHNKHAEQVQMAEVKQSRVILLRQLHGQLLEDKKLLGQLKSNEHSLKLLLGKLQQAPESDSGNKQPVPAVSAESRGAKVENKPKMEAAKRNDFSDESAVAIDQAAAEPALADSGKSFGELKGRLAWPVAGSILRNAGSEQVEVGRGGVLIESPEGSAVHAVAGGHVAYAGWMRGYGLLTIVNHGGGFMTVYAFNQSLYKKVGAKVSAGEAIASVGQSGGQSNNGLYFEIRKNGQPLPPEAWCKK